MSPPRRSFLALALAAPSSERFITDGYQRIVLSDLRGGSCLDAVWSMFVGRTVLLLTTRPLSSMLAAMELDGIASRLLFCTPDLIKHLGSIIERANVDIVLTDKDMLLRTVGDDDATPIWSALQTLGVICLKANDKIISHGHPEPVRDIETEWVLFTSGTTGQPKMVAHTLASLSGPLNDGVSVADGTIWATFYDPRRYGGLTIFFRAMLGGGSMILSDAQEPMDQFLLRAGDLGGESGATHITGTPSHWRQALLSPSINLISPFYVRMSGEVADQAILDRVKQEFPQANIAHAFASTEAGVGFDVRDGKAGFPASFVPHPNDNPLIEMRIKDGTIWLRSTRIANGYLDRQFTETDGFIDTGDLVELQGDRYFFRGRREGVINVGGQKVFPEEVENVITEYPAVQIARVWGRKSPITGQIVAADVILRSPVSTDDFRILSQTLTERCKERLAPYKVPVTWRQVDTIAMTASGKVSRSVQP